MMKITHNYQQQKIKEQLEEIKNINVGSKPLKTISFLVQ